MMRDLATLPAIALASAWTVTCFVALILPVLAAWHVAELLARDIGDPNPLDGLGGVVMWVSMAVWHPWWMTVAMFRPDQRKG